MSNVVTLEAIFNTKGFAEGSKAIKDVGTVSQDTGKKVTDLTGKLDKTEKTTTSLSTKVKDFGSKFQSSIGSLSTFGGTVLNLSRQYQDLSDSQIRVDKTQLKVSKTTEAARTAQGKLNQAIKQFGVGSAQAKQAQLDLTQAEEAATLATTMHGEALEDQQRAQENFWIGLVPTVTSAGGSIMSVLNDIGGEKGIGGLAEKFKGLGKSAGGLGGAMGALKSGGTGLMGVLGPLGLAIAGVSFAFLYAKDVFEQTQKVMAEFKVAKNLTDTTKSIEGMDTALDKLKLHPGIGSLREIGDAIASFGPGALKNNFVEMMKEDAKNARLFDDEMKKIPPTMDAAATSSDRWVNMMIKAIQSTDPQKMIEFNKAFKESGQSTERYQQIVIAATAAIDKSKEAHAKLTTTLNTTGQGLGEVDQAVVKLAPDMMTSTKNTNEFTGALVSVGIAMDKAKPKDLFTFLSESGGKFKEASTGADSLAIAIANVGIKMMNTKQAFADSVQNAKAHAEASLQLQQVFQSMGTTLTPLQAAMASMNTADQKWIQDQKDAVTAENQHKQSLVAFLQANGASNASLKMTIQTLETAVVNLFRGAKGYDALTRAIQTTTQATVKYNYAAGTPVPKGKKVSGPVYSYKGQTYYGTPQTGHGGYTAAYYNKQYPHKALGMSGRVSHPTWILAGEGGRQEDVHINPVGHSGRNAPTGQGRGPIIVNVFVDGVLKRARYDIVSNEGIFK